MALADIYVLEDQQVWNGTEPFMNVYTYMRTDGAGSAEQLARAYVQDVQTSIEVLQNQIVNHVNCRVYSLGDLTDFYEFVQTGNTGGGTGAVMPSFVTVNFTLRAASRAVRPGRKGISGLQEDATTGDVITNTTTISQINAIRDAMAATIESPVDATTYVPVIVKRVPYVTDNGNDAYRWPETEGELVAPLVTGVLTNLRVSHQTSRGNSR